VRIVTGTAFARAALVGNPSDGYGGRTISFAFRDFSARAVVYEWPRVEIIPGPSDQVTFGSVDELVADVEANGYYGGLRLTKAAIVRFAAWCRERSIALEPSFSIRYESSIPRGVGLGGSSAIVTAVLRGLCEFYEVEIPPEELPSVALSAETEELDTAAGLQDRVAQAYEGLTYMDFDRALVADRGHGAYEPLDPGLLPPVLIAHQASAAQPSHEAHAEVRGRFRAGDEEVEATMSEIAELAGRGREALLAGDRNELGRLMRANLDLRRQVFELDPRHLRMAEIAAELGLAANYAGSGGAIVVLRGDPAADEELRRRLSAEGCELIEPTLATTRLRGKKNGPPP
jgi:glucuronokinase